MDIDFASQIWDSLTTYISATDMKHAADDMVNLLIDAGAEPEDIKDAFRGDSAIKKALKQLEAQYDEDEDEDD